MKGLLTVAALAEALTGVVLLLFPSIVVQLLFGTGIVGAGVVMSRLAGISLIGLGLACWPDGPRAWPLIGLFTYSTLAMLYLASVSLRHQVTGVLLWPMVVVHAGLSAVVAVAWFRGKRAPETHSPRAPSTPRR